MTCAEWHRMVRSRYTYRCRLLQLKLAVPLAVALVTSMRSERFWLIMGAFFFFFFFRFLFYTLSDWYWVCFSLSLLFCVLPFFKSSTLYFCQIRNEKSNNTITSKCFFLLLLLLLLSYVGVESWLMNRFFLTQNLSTVWPTLSRLKRKIWRLWTCGLSAPSAQCLRDLDWLNWVCYSNTCNTIQ